MDGTNPKVSFIPKGSLVREESFLSRPRPRSAIGILASIVFIASVGSYAGLAYYNNSLNEIIVETTAAITNVQKEFSDAPEVSEAKIFRARADLAKNLLYSHTTVSPVLTFLSKNTTESILYDKFSYKNDLKGHTVELSGEAPNYSALAYQTDVLKTKAEALSSFSVGNVALTKFGTVTFTLTLSFNPGYLLYTKNLSNNENPSRQSEVPATIVPSAPAQVDQALKKSTTNNSSSSTGTASSDNLTENDATSMQATSTEESATGGDSNEVSGITTSHTPSVEEVQEPEPEQSALMRLWLKFKFW